jgi:prephenate dehydratase
MTGEEDKTLMLVNPPDVDTAGSLLNVLTVFKDQAINLTDLHSISIPGSGTRRKQFLIEADSGYRSREMSETLRDLGSIGCNPQLLGSWIDNPITTN